MNDIAQLISNYGMSVVLLAWMIYKDYKFNTQILAVLDKVTVVLTRLETWHSIQEGEETA